MLYKTCSDFFVKFQLVRWLILVPQLSDIPVVLPIYQLEYVSAFILRLT